MYLLNLFCRVCLKRINTIFLHFFHLNFEFHKNVLILTMKFDKTHKIISFIDIITLFKKCCL